MITPHDKNFVSLSVKISDVINKRYLNLGQIDINTLYIYFDSRNNLVYSPEIYTLHTVVEETASHYNASAGDIILLWEGRDLSHGVLYELIHSGEYEYFCLMFIKL